MNVNQEYLRELARSDNWSLNDIRAALRSAADTIEGLTAPSPQPAGKTVRVRVAVAVDPDGNWGAFSTNKCSNPQDEALQYVSEDLLAAEYWLTADLPIPQPVEIKATVEQPE